MTRAPKLHFSTMGSQDNAPLMLLHGFMGCSQDWTEVIEELSKFYYCIVVDLPWHGDSPPLFPNGRAFEQTAQALLHIQSTQHIDKCALLGYSMGGRLAMYAAIHDADAFGPLIIESASPGIEGIIDLKAQQYRDRNIANLLRNDDFAYFLHFWYEQPLFESIKRHPRFEALLRDRLKGNPAMFADAIRALSAGVQPSLWHELEKRSTPMLMLAGEHDSKYKNIAQMLQRRRPQTAIDIIPGCGHNIHFENSAIFCKKVMQFLNAKM